MQLFSLVQWLDIDRGHVEFPDNMMNLRSIFRFHIHPVI